MRADYLLFKNVDLFLRYKQFFNLPETEIAILLHNKASHLAHGLDENGMADEEKLQGMKQRWKDLLIAYYRETRPGYNGGGNQ